MSRIRSTHPGLWTDEAFVTLSPFARLMFMGLWNECDDSGSFAWSPLGLKMKLLPADNVDANELLTEMISAGLVKQYEVAGKRYGAVRNFCQFQRPKKPNSIYPQTDEIRNWVNTDARSLRDGSEAVGNRLPTGGEKSRQMEDGGGKKDSSEGKPSGAAPPADPVKELFDLGVSMLVAAGKTDKEARSLLGLWRKAAGGGPKGDAEVMVGLMECRAKLISEPVEWLSARFKPAKWVSKSGYEYRGSDQDVLREAERRGDMDTYWSVKAATSKAEKPPKKRERTSRRGASSIGTLIPALSAGARQ